MRPILLLPIIAAALLGTSALQATLTKWGPTEPSYQLVMQYRTDAYVLDSGLTKDDCDDALPFGDNIKHVHFSCVVGG
ncbi:hypothetical protein [Sphingobium sp.]|uniref:hypothetical protein n=1 Tax=Sphingobium sp. TaxID=1912891 RepID=UPI002B9D6A3D|nr:hypothetical protein [Sphingobium sp.]HUD90086.1 hypothetical protein [Sphingobium sp.]